MIYYNQDFMIRDMEFNVCETLENAFKQQERNKPKSLFEGYYKEQTSNKRIVLIAEKNEQILGYVTLIKNTLYGPFKDLDIPEVVDFNVLIKYQRKGIGDTLMGIVEAIAFKTNENITLAVGLHSGYGNSQCMYIKRGYILDGSGGWYQN